MLIAEAVAHQVAAGLAADLAARTSATPDPPDAQPAAVLLAPGLPFGASGEHEGFPGTVSIGTEATALVLLEWVRSVTRWAGRVVVVNGHGGNSAALQQAVDTLDREGRQVVVLPCAVAGSDLHAGRTETSVMLHLAPWSVHLDRAIPGCRTPAAQLLPVLRSQGVRAVSPSGVLGDPTGASAEEGHSVFDGMVRQALRRLTWHSQGAG